MKAKFFIITPLFFLNILLVNELKAQTYPVDKGAKILSGKLHFSSAGGDLFENNDEDRQTEFSLSPALSFFPSPNFFLGGQLSYSSARQGEAKSSSLGIGPHIGVAGGNPTSNAYPYASVAALLTNNTFDVGSGGESFGGHSFIFSGGVWVTMIEHIGLDVSLSYRITNLKLNDNERLTGNSIEIGLGVVGLLYN